MAFIDDTSGSISQAEKDAFLGEFNAIVEDIMPEKIYVMYVDTRVQEVEEVEPDDYPVKLKNIHGGGTRFEPPFEWLEERNIEPSILVYMTDLEGTCNIPEPPYPVLWVCTSTLGQDSVPFGKVIHLKV